MKGKETKGRKALLAIAVAVAGVVTYGSTQSTVAHDGRSDIDRRTRAEKISRFGHSTSIFVHKTNGDRLFSTTRTVLVRKEAGNE